MSRTDRSPIAPPDAPRSLPRRASQTAPQTLPGAPAGCASGSTLRRVPARWTRQGDDVTLHYGAGVDRFELDRARRGSGDDRDHNRLTALEPIHPRSLVGAGQLWLLEAAP
ncbi:MAG: hypothetical protein ACQGVK_14700 [Myxococcota bacterium]